MQEYLAFVDEIGIDRDGKYIYRFDFTENVDVVWGDFFNVSPAIIIPNLQPDIKYISSSFNVSFNKQLLLAKKNSCFSMQDCIDGIIALAFSDIDCEYIEVDGLPLYFVFGETIERVNEKIKEIGVSPYGHTIHNNTDSNPIDDLINSDMLENNNCDF